MLLRWLISTIGFAALKDQMRRSIRRAIFATVAIVLWLIALAFLVVAFTVWLASVVGLIWALVIIAGAFVVVALIIQISLAVTKKKGVAAAAATVEGLSLTGVLPELGGAGVIAGGALVAYLLARQFFRR